MYPSTKKLLLFFVTAQCLVVISCKKLVSIDDPTNRLTSDLVFTNDKSAISAISGLYSKILNSTSFANGGMTIYTGMSADEIVNTIPGTNDEFSKNTLTTSNTVVGTSFWANGYNYIYQANAIIEGLNKSTGLTPATKNQVMGEAKFLRAFFYFYLTNIFGDVPLIINTSFEESSKAARNNSQTVYDQIVNDLTDAKGLLGIAYPTTGRVRPNRWTATALLARVYLYLKDWTKAEAEATAVISSNVYSLVNNLNAVFLSGSNEAIWQLLPNSTISSSTQNVYEGNVFIPATGIVPVYSILNHLLNSFEAGDQRKVSWIGKTIINGVSYSYPFKYKIRTSSSITEYYVVFRLAEQYLIRAEARAQQNNLVQAYGDVNIIRRRAGLADISGISQSLLLDSILHERQSELFSEWGHRFLDLKRTQKADLILGTTKAPNWQSTDALYPIPQTQINVNVNLTQNPGY
jgi:hypothetical protein